METQGFGGDSPALSGVASQKCTWCMTEKPLSDFSFTPCSVTDRMHACKTCVAQYRRKRLRYKFDCVVGFVVSVIGAFCAAWGGIKIGALLWSRYNTWYSGFDTPATSIGSHDRGVHSGLVFVLMFASTQRWARRETTDEMSDLGIAFVLIMLVLLILSIVG